MLVLLELKLGLSEEFELLVGKDGSILNEVMILRSLVHVFILDLASEGCGDEARLLLLGYEDPVLNLVGNIAQWLSFSVEG